jgi:hypothetical protein
LVVRPVTGVCQLATDVVKIAVGVSVEPDTGMTIHSYCVPLVGVLIGNELPSQTIVGVDAVSVGNALGLNAEI